MRKTWLSLILLSLFFLSACSGVTSPGIPATIQPVETVQAVRPTIPADAIAMECQVVSSEPTPGPTEVSIFPSIQDEDWKKGAANPRMTIIEYSDFQCPYCSLLAQELDLFMQEHSDEVQLAFRHFPITSLHPLALTGAYAAEAAGLQGKFWEMHDLLFASQGTTATMTEDQFIEWLPQQAESIGLDQEQFQKDLESQLVMDKIDQALKFAQDAEIPGTPLVLINGEIYSGPRDAASFEAMLDLFYLEDRQFTSCPPMVIDIKKEYTATLKTEKGDVVIQLFADKAPLAVNSFVFLAQNSWYDGQTFYYVVSGVLAQTGDPSSTGLGSPGYLYTAETNDLNYDKPGVVGMVDTDAAMNGSQFFITSTALPDFNGKYTIFGEVIEGMDVMNSLTPRDPTTQMGLEPGDEILTVSIEEK